MKLFTKSLLIFALLGLVAFSPIIRAAEDEVEDLEDEIDESLNEKENVDSQTPTETEADEESLEENTGSPHAKTNILFVKPHSSFDLPAGRPVKILVGFHNAGEQDYVVQSLEASFRYPQDFSYHIQNFTAAEINKAVVAEEEATFEYMFVPSETFESRQFGLTINLRYRNADGKEFHNAVYNETVNIIEPEEGLDGETFFLYIFLAAILILCGFGLYQFLAVFGKKKGRSSAKSYSQSASKVSNGNGSSDEIDFEWIPQSHLQPSKSPKTSPRLRKNKSGAQLSGNSSADDQ